MAGKNSYTVLGLRALTRAARKVAENAKKNDLKIPVWKNGDVHYEIPASGAEKRTSASGAGTAGSSFSGNSPAGMTEEGAGESDELKG